MLVSRLIFFSEFYVQSVGKFCFFFFNLEFVVHFLSIKILFFFLNLIMHL